MPINPLCFAFSTFFAFSAFAMPVASASPNCDGLTGQDQAVCERGERDFPKWRALRDGTCKQSDEERSLYTWSDRFGDICRRAFLLALQAELAEPESHFRTSATRDKYFRFVGVAVARQLLPNGEPLPEQLHKNLESWTADRLQKHREGYRDDDAPDGQFGSVAIEYVVTQAGVGWVGSSAINADYGEWYYIEGMPHGQWFGISKLYDRSTGRFVASLDELFNDSTKVIGIVAKIMIAELAAGDYQPRDEELIKAYVREPAHWRFSNGKFEIAFSPYSLGPYIPASVKPVSLAILAPYIKKDGPLGRSLSLK